MNEPRETPEEFVRYNLYTRRLAGVMLDPDVSGDAISVTEVTLETEADRELAASLWSAQTIANFKAREEKLPEFARRKEVPALYTAPSI